MSTPKVGLDRSKTGRKKGTPNKATAAIKDMIEGALSDVGGRAYLARQAEENPAAFMTLVGKILPKDINVGGQADNPLTVNKIQIEFVDTKA